MDGKICAEREKKEREKERKNIVTHVNHAILFILT
jgi:hypothetical protein